MMGKQPGTYLWTFLVALSTLFYHIFAYNLERTNSLALLTIYGSLFIVYLLLYKYGRDHFAQMVGAGLLFRLILLFAIPNLSQDFYRFIWDGELMLMGTDPYLYTPDELFKEVSGKMPDAGILYEGMGALSASHYSNYPPLNQVFFALAAFLGQHSLEARVIVLKLIMILGDLMTLWFGARILKLLQKPRSLLLLYFLNPFVILELTGNLHFEGVMMGFLTGGLWFLFRKRYPLAVLFIAASISLKLIPLIFLPLLYMHYTNGQWLPGTKRTLGALVFTGAILLLAALSFTPFTSFTNLEHFTASVNLWFSRFEFNASLYYLAREVGFWIKGYNVIGSIAPWIPVITLGTVLALCFNKRNGEPKQLLTSMLWAITIYLFISTTVHPWYLATPLILAVMLHKKYMVVWTGLVMLSYTAYAHPEYKENALLLWVEYGVTFIIFYLEMIRRKRIKAF
ncbi:putative hexosyltransferase [Robertkochia sediminum]|uniref:glycosyltransferase 87 family protein n=1 Tax=Robertkochia sediminum TaxID=2785326 RepID=UPI0019317690|nr:glycosyltransferase 87 family protein [Robertkochia sediminum]MBL7473063.1 mannosyltransferase [Robertkochia sediminum]